MYSYNRAIVLYDQFISRMGSVISILIIVPEPGIKPGLIHCDSDLDLKLQFLI